MVFFDVGVGHCGPWKCRSAWSGRYVLLPRSSTVEVAAAAPAVHLWAQLTLQLRQAPDPGAVGAEVGLDLGGELADGGQLGSEQLGASLQRRCDRPAQVRIVPGPHSTQVIEH
jgi:hypothetical protein